MKIHSLENSPNGGGWVPCRITSIEAANLLGFGCEDGWILNAVGLIKLFGKAAPNAAECYFSRDVEVLGMYRSWLGKTTVTITLNWKNFNQQVVQEAATIRTLK
jgi:hypothetical protein